MVIYKGTEQRLRVEVVFIQAATAKVSRNGSRVLERNPIGCDAIFHPLIHYICVKNAAVHMYSSFFIWKGETKMKIKNLTVSELCKIAMLVAITVMLSYISGYLRFGPVSKLNISFISVYVAGAAFGPLISGLVAAMADVVSFLANPTGAFMPVFTILEFAGGFLFGLILYHKDSDSKIGVSFAVRVVICVLLQYLVNVIRTYMLAQMYYDGKFWFTFVQRIPSTSIMAGVKIFGIIIIEPFMKTILKMIRK